MARASPLPALLLALLAAPGCDAALLSRANASVPCPSTSLWISTSDDAAGTPVFMGPYDLPSPGQCVPCGVEGIKIAKICGPGTFTISRMSCDRHDYKAHTIEHPGTQFTEGDCKEYKTAGTNVDGYVGSATFSCSSTER